MVKENRLPITTNYGRNARIGVLPKRPLDPSSKGVNVRWFELSQPMVTFHTVNAWQEGDTIRLFTCLFDKVGCWWLQLWWPPLLLLESRAAVAATGCCICKGMCHQQPANVSLKEANGPGSFAPSKQSA